MKKLIFLFIIASSFIFSNCSRNPVTGKREISLMSESKELALGKSSDEEIVQSFGLYQNPILQNFINTKGKEMAAISHRSHLDFDFKILDSPVVNAFAVPGGYVYFTRGILAHFNNEAEFAGVLGHEIGHVTAKHSVKQYSKEMVLQGIFMGGVVLSEEFRKYADVASQGMGLLFLKFSRDNESESDRLGVEYSTKVGYDSYNMANFFSTLKKLSAGSTIPSFLSTHPDPLDRNQKVAELSDEWQSKLKLNRTSLKTNRNEYLRMIDGLIYGEDPKQGFVQNDKFYHPAMKFVFDVPIGWQIDNTPSQIVIAPQDGLAMVVMTVASGTLEQARSEVIQANEFNVIETANANVNGLKAIKMTSDQTQAATNGQAAEKIRILTYLIEYNGQIFVFHGMAKMADFNKYFGNMQNTMKSFSELKETAMLNKQPETIQIITITKNQTLSNALAEFNMPQARFEELAILNGMELSTQLSKGQLIKTIK